MERVLTNAFNRNGAKLYNLLRKFVQANNIEGSWGAYQLLLKKSRAEREVEPASGLGLSRNAVPRRKALTAEMQVREANELMPRVLGLKAMHGYTAAQIDTMARRARLLLGEIARSGQVLPSRTLNEVLGLFATARNGEAADRVWQYAVLSTAPLDVTNYNSYINAMIRAENLTRAFEISNEMRQRGIQPNGFTRVLRIRLCGLAGDLPAARREFGEACRYSRIPVDPGIPVPMPAQEYWHDAHDDLRLGGGGVHACNAMLEVLGMNGLMDELRLVFAQMLGLQTHDEVDSAASPGQAAVRPTMETFHVMIKWHAKYWDLDGAMRHVRLMPRFHLRPEPKTVKLLITPETAHRNVRACADIAVELASEFHIVLPASTLRILNAASKAAQKMDDMVRASEDQPTMPF
ncbi:hypothetical protein GGF46_000381 [Coemansia sp. RSA 552]|nr:hypothetical protein GGF46_000381 [Coemansia sp. RSA 552]